jgi:hypothetical protein
MKILTNSLSKKLVDNFDILKDHNFAGLPGKSTVEPIHTLNLVLEDARYYKKEAWILLQDMSKAYDLVNRENLLKALRRIRLPDTFILFIENTLKGRKNKVITDFGLTDYYEVTTGIDQGEIMSPLLWIIYYDPLFAKIRKKRDNAEIGYEITDVIKKNSNTNAIRITDLAYMDDSTWIGNSKQDLSTILNITDSFNKFNGIKVNKEKSRLLVLNSKLTTEEKFICYGENSIKIYPIDNKESIRFLGVWISPERNKNFIASQIKKENEEAYEIMKYKHLTDDQISYIFNTVIVPRIEYRMNLTVFNETELNHLTTKIRKLLRNKSRSRTQCQTAF